jgi:hypothetical protein
MRNKHGWIKYKGTNLKKRKEFGTIKSFIFPENG